MTSVATLRLQNVSVVRGGLSLISGLSLDLSGPKLLWVTGGNGIGKTSLLRTCAGLSHPDTGEVNWSIMNQSVTAPEAVSFLPANSYAKPGLTAAEDAEFWGADLASTQIDTHHATQTQHLSTGQAKRLSLSKLLAEKKPIWIMDEPLAGLDDAGRHLVADILHAHVSAGGLALVASHAPITVNGVPTQKLALS